MKTKVFSIYDSKAEAYMTPFFAATKDTAIRMVVHNAHQADSMLGRFSEDYSLFELGSWNEDIGEITMHDELKPCGSVVALLKGNTPKEWPATAADLARINPDQIAKLREAWANDQAEPETNGAIYPRTEKGGN